MFSPCSIKNAVDHTMWNSGELFTEDVSTCQESIRNLRGKFREVFGNFVSWLPLQSLAVKKKNFIFANFGRWKTLRKVPVKYFQAAWEGLKIYRSRFGSLFGCFFFQAVFCIDLKFWGTVSFCRHAAVRNFLSTSASFFGKFARRHKDSN